MKAVFTEKAIELVLLDAIEKGLTTPAEAVAYMQTPAFDTQVLNYLQMFEAEFTK